MQPRKKISIVVIAKKFADPAGMERANYYAQFLHANQIPFVVCEEWGEKTLATRKTNISNNLKQIIPYFNHAEIIKFIKNNKRRPYFDKSDYEAIKKVISGMPITQDEFKAQQNSNPKYTIDDYVSKITDNLYRKNAYEYSITLNETLERLHTIYVGVKNPESVVTQAFPKLANDGVVIVLTNEHYARVFLTDLLKPLASRSITARHDVKVFSLRLFSRYSEDEILKSEIGGMIRAAYMPAVKNESAQCLLATYAEAPDGSFPSKELTDAFAKAIQHVLPSQLGIYSIPNFDTMKAKIVHDLKGVVRQIDQNHHATIEISSDALKKDVREQLGIDRKAITFFNDAKERIAFLKHDKLVTVEETKMKEDQFFVTYPKDRQKFVSNVCDDTAWKAILERRAKFADSSSKAYKGLLALQSTFKNKKAARSLVMMKTDHSDEQKCFAIKKS